MVVEGGSGTEAEGLAKVYRWKTRQRLRSRVRDFFKLALADKPSHPVRAQDVDDQARLPVKSLTAIAPTFPYSFAILRMIASSTKLAMMFLSGAGPRRWRCQKH